MTTQRNQAQQFCLSLRWTSVTRMSGAAHYRPEYGFNGMKAAGKLG